MRPSIGTSHTLSALAQGLPLIFKLWVGAMAIRNTPPHTQASTAGQPYLDVKRLSGKGAGRTSAQTKMITSLDIAFKCWTEPYKGHALWLVTLRDQQLLYALNTELKTIPCCLWHLPSLLRGVKLWDCPVSISAAKQEPVPWRQLRQAWKHLTEPVRTRAQPALSPLV